MQNSQKRHFYKIAHRGASAYEPENTLRSFRRALDMGADLIEFDIRMSSDGHLIVIHDKKVDRTTDGTGLVREMTLGQLKKLDAGKGEKIPTLEEVIDFGKGKTRFVIELKEGGVEGKIVDVIKQNDLLEDVVIVSYHSKLVKNVKQLESRVTTGLISLLPFNAVGSGKESLVDIVAPFHYLVTRGLVEKIHRNGMFLFTWVVDSQKRAEKLKEIGVDGIVTNKPDIK